MGGRMALADHLRGLLGRKLTAERDLLTVAEKEAMDALCNALADYAARDRADEAMGALADLLAQRAGIDLGEAVRRKFNAVSERVGSGVRV